MCGYHKVIIEVVTKYVLQICIVHVPHLLYVKLTSSVKLKKNEKITEYNKYNNTKARL